MKYIFTLLLYIAVVDTYIYHSGSYFENSTDVAFSVYANGLINKQPVSFPETYAVNVGLMDLTVWLKELFPGLNWYGVISYICSSLILLQLIFFNYTASTVSMQSIPDFLKYFLMPLVIVTDIFLVQDITRQSFYLALNAWLISWAKPRLSISGALLIMASIALAAMRRVEIALIVGVLCFFASLAIRSIFQYKRINFAIVTVATTISVIIIFVFTQMSGTTQGALYKAVRPYENMIIDIRPDTSLLKLRNEYMQVTYQCATKFFFNDTAHINIDFYRSAGIIPYERTPLQSFMLIFNKLPDRKYINFLTHEIWIHSKYYIIAALLSLPLLFLSVRNRKDVWYLVVFVLFYFALFVFVNLYLKYEPKFNEPYLLSSVAIACTVVLRSSVRGIRRAFITMVCIFAGIALILQSKCIYHKHQQRKADADYFKNVFHVIHTLPPGSFAVLNIGVWDNLAIPVLCQLDVPKQIGILSIDNGMLYMYPQQAEYLTRVTGSRTFIGRMNYLSNEHVFWFSPQYRIDMLKKYVNTVYRTSYDFEVVQYITPQEPDPLNYSKVGVYQLKNKEPL